MFQSRRPTGTAVAGGLPVAPDIVDSFWFTRSSASDRGSRWTLVAGSTDGARARIVKRAARWLQDARRLDMQGLADELGISRVTLFRRVGGREALLSEATWLLTERTLAVSVERWERERGPDELRTAGTGRQMNAIVSQSKALRRLLEDEPTLALRVLTDPRGRVQTGIVTFFAELLKRDAAEFGVVPLIDPGDLAYALVRLGESFVYADVLAARAPDVATADRLQLALLEGMTARPGPGVRKPAKAVRKANPVRKSAGSAG